MSEMKHTPLPWGEDGGVIFGAKTDERGRRYGVAVTNTPFGPQAGFVNLEENTANRQFIVTAVNAHYDLLEACQMAYRYIESDHCECGANKCNRCLRLEHLGAAIAKATGSTPSTAPERLYTFSEVESGARSGILEWVKAHTDWVFPAYYTEHLTNAATRSLRRPDPGATPIDTPARFSEEQVNESLTYVTRIWVQRGHIGDFEADQLRIAALEVLKHPRDGSTPSTGETNNSEK